MSFEDYFVYVKLAQVMWRFQLVDWGEISVKENK